MENNEWEESLKDKLGEYKPEGLQPDWDAFLNYLSINEQITEWEQDASFDENLKDTVTNFAAPVLPEGWERIEASLDLADRQFDEHVRDKIAHYNPQYNPRTWPLLMSRISGVGYLRAKLIAFKVVEVAAVMLLLITVLKMGQMGKLPFETAIFEKHKLNGQLPQGGMADFNSAEDVNDAAQIQSKASSESFDDDAASVNESGNEQNAFADNTTAAFDSNETRSQFSANRSNRSNDLAVQKPEKLNDKSPTPITFVSVNSIQTEIEIMSIGENLAFADTDVEDKKQEGGQLKNDIPEIAVRKHRSFGATFMSTILSPVRWNQQVKLPKPHFVKQRSRTYTEFGIVSQLDYNLMRMPEDKFYTYGKHVVFPQQGLPSRSLGGGFSIAVGHPRWALETGLIYSGKNFRPGRQLIVGDAINNSNLEFEAMSLQLFSIPMHYRYRFDNNGAFRFYGLAGSAIHLIAQSNIDIVVNYNFSSLAPGENPNTNPSSALTIRETKRISEHIRDGAPFSTKSFVSLNAGAGIEYAVSENKTLFFQTTVQYQVPNLKFSNNNGKHLRSMSVQAGVRTPLGK